MQDKGRGNGHSEKRAERAGKRKPYLISNLYLWGLYFGFWFRVAHLSRAVQGSVCGFQSSGVPGASKSGYLNRVGRVARHIGIEIVELLSEADVCRSHCDSRVVARLLSKYTVRISISIQV